MTQSNITRRRIVDGIAASVGFAAADASGDIIGAARAQPARKTFVLVHGTLVGGWYWRRVSDFWKRRVTRYFPPP
jgi:hypothetical protein